MTGTRGEGASNSSQAAQEAQSKSRLCHRYVVCCPSSSASQGGGCCVVGVAVTPCEVEVHSRSLGYCLVLVRSCLPKQWRLWQGVVRDNTRSVSHCHASWLGRGQSFAVQHSLNHTMALWPSHEAHASLQLSSVESLFQEFVAPAATVLFTILRLRQPWIVQGAWLQPHRRCAWA
jgi:hypothetical protein